MERRRFLTLGGLAHASAPFASLVRAQTYGSPIDPTAAKLDAAIQLQRKSMAPSLPQAATPAVVLAS